MLPVLYPPQLAVGIAPGVLAFAVVLTTIAEYGATPGNAGPGLAARGVLGFSTLVLTFLNLLEFLDLLGGFQNGWAPYWGGIFTLLFGILLAVWVLFRTAARRKLREARR